MITLRVSALRINTLTFLDSNNVNVVLIPPNSTDKLLLQPLDLSVNKAAKESSVKTFRHSECLCSTRTKDVKKPIDCKATGSKMDVRMIEYYKSQI